MGSPRLSCAHYMRRGEAVACARSRRPEFVPFLSSAVRWRSNSFHHPRTPSSALNGRTMRAAREEVSTDDLLSRHIFDPPMFAGRTLVAKFFFEFPQNRCESVIWQRKLLDAIDGVHRLGCEHRAKLRQRQAAEGKVPTKKYVGAATARCGEIRGYKNPQGHGIKVVHEPDEGAHHVELCYDSDASAPAMTSTAFPK